MGLMKNGEIVFGLLVIGLGLFIFYGCFNPQNDFQTRLASLIGGIITFCVGIGIIYFALKSSNTTETSKY
jgi:hypothetical protein